MIAQTAAWIVNADTKAGLLLTAVAVVAAALTGQVKATLARFPAVDGRQVVVLILSAVAAVLLAGSVFHVCRVLGPRTPVAAAETRFSWPWVAEQSAADICGRDITTTRQEAWTQAVTLSIIARAKFEAFRFALFFAVAGSTMLALATIAGL